VGSGAVVAEKGSGKLLQVDAAGQTRTVASGFSQPGEVVVANDGSLFVSDLGAGRITRVEKDGSVATLVDGLSKPSGLALLRQDTLLVLDRGTKELYAVSLDTKQKQTLASALPIGDPPGCSRGPMEFSGGLAVAQDGAIYIAGDGEGSVLALRQV
jgi:sugar lactone lactonase YvrE